jgi:S1-C subfamily serine protease
VAIVIGAFWTETGLRAPRPLTQDRLNAAVNFALDHRPQAPSPAATGYATIAPSLVRIEGYNPKRDPLAGAGEAFPSNNAILENAPIAPGDKPVVTGGGIVVDRFGSILTNLHLAKSARRLRVVFADGSQSDAVIDTSDPATDTAVLKADVKPEVLPAATLGSAGTLHPGDPVLTVGFPFGIGPSVSDGIVSGTNRVLPPDGERAQLNGLIQFDAAANPGNIGGPLTNDRGEVVGLVAAVFNPSGAGTFAGIGFAVPIESATQYAMPESPF